MQCPLCQHDNPAPARFCLGCGAKLSFACSACGIELPASVRFCFQCGQAVAIHGAASVARPTPAAYIPRHLAEKILTSKAALEGERKQVTVLFADVKGSLELLTDRDPEEARKLLDPILELMMEAVHRYEGTVNQVMGDGIMALFGAPLAHEDHAARACYAALRMQEAISQCAEDVLRQEGVRIQIRIGLNSGEVVVRSIGSDLHMDYTAVGQTTHLAARMEQLAAPGTALLSSETLRLAVGFVQVKPVGLVNVKGLAEPVEVYTLSGPGPARTRFQAAATRGLTPVVGRDAEMEQLRHALVQAGQGHGQVVAVVGEPGVGKSRLFYEFTRSQHVRDWLVLESGSVSYGQATPYLPVIDLLKTYFHLEPRDDAPRIQERVTGKTLELDRTLEPMLPAFLSLLDVLPQDSAWHALDPRQRRQHTLDGVRRLLLRESQVQPLVLVFEDVHWIDSETQAVLDGLVEGLPAARVLLLVNYRPEYRHRWGGKTYYTQLRLDALPPETAEEFLHSLLGADPALVPLKQLLIGRTEGNPFFLEESVRTLIETHVLVGERGAYRLARDVTSVQVAPTVQAVLAARIDRLSFEHKRLLQSAAVIGKDVPFPLLRGIADESEADVRRGLSQLQTAEFLYETTLFPDLQYTFKHALTHEVAYGSLLHDRRRGLHARIVEVIETLYPDRLAEQIERLGYHASLAERWEKALTYLRQAGAKAFARSANRESAAYFEQALAALQHLPETRETLEQAIDLRFDLRNSLLPLGKFETFFGYLREAEVLARKLDDQRRLGWMSVYMCHYFWMTGRSTEARTFGESAHAIAHTLGDRRLTVVASFYLGLACFAAGDYLPAEDFLQKAVQSLDGDLGRERCGLAGFPAVMSRSYLGLALAHRGKFDEGIACAQEGVHLAEGFDHPYSLIVASWSLGSLHAIRGDLEEAGRALERGLALCRDWKLAVLVPLVTGPLGHVYALSGRVPEGLSLLHQALEGMESMGRGAYHSLILLQLGEGCVLAGRFPEALASVERALRLTRERGERGYEALALRLLGEISSHGDAGEVETVAGRYESALALADALGIRPLVAHCHFGLGKLYRRTGDHQQAQEHLTTATTMYCEMEMRFWLKKAEAEMSRPG
jgi:class 3 adenylate cyclase/tetratricopeptide (TPR) repeat protein